MIDFKAYILQLQDALREGNATEHTHRPFLKGLLEGIHKDLRATNEPSRIECGAPDYVVTRSSLTVGYIEVKDVGRSLNEAEQTEQLQRYRKALPNLILSDYLQFRWYVDGELRQEACLAKRQSNGSLKIDNAGASQVDQLLTNFLSRAPITITEPRDLAERMARLTHIVRDIIIEAFSISGLWGLLSKQSMRCMRSTN